MQLLAEAPAIGVDAGDGVVAQVQLVQRGKAIERATVHFCQAVIFQVAVEKNHKELTVKQHWSNAERISKKNWDFSQTHMDTCMGGHFLSNKDRNSRTTQTKFPEEDVTGEKLHCK